MAIAKRKQKVNDGKALCMLWRKWVKISLSRFRFTDYVQHFFFCMGLFHPPYKIPTMSEKVAQ